MSKGGGEPQPETTGIGLTERVGYGLGDTASNLYFQFFNFFLLYYYTDVFGLNAAAVGTMYLVANLWDAVNDPLMGAIADRTRTRHGLYRPYLLWFALPYGFFGYLIFANPSGLGETGKLAFAYVTFIAFKMVYTAINIPYSAMMGVMTSDARERIELSAARFLGAFGGGFMVSLLVRPLVKVFGGDDEVAGFQGTMALFGVLSVVMFLVTFFTTRERVPPLVEKVDVLTDLKILSQNRPWLIMIAAAVCTLASVAVRGAVTVHFFKYVVGASDEALFALGAEGSAFRLEFDATTLFLSASSLSFIVGVAMTGVVSKLMGKRNGLILLTLANGLVILTFFVIPPSNYTLMMVANVVASLLAGPTPALVWALYTDVADYGEVMSGRRATALVFSAAMFAQKMGLTIGGSASGWLLDYFGFVANQEQTPRALLGIRLMFAVVPGALALLNGLILLFYPLSDAQADELRAQLEARRHAES